MTVALDDPYDARLRRVLDYIDHHLDDDLCIERLGAIAVCSPYHFQRQFTARVGVPVHRYVVGQRLRRAAALLAFRRLLPIGEIAVASGYDGPEAFCRAFKRLAGQSPSEFRRRPDWRTWHDRLAAFSAPARPARDDHAHPVRIVARPETPIALLTHRGDPRLLGDTLRAFIAWRCHHQLPPRSHATFNLLHDDPGAVPPAAFRLDLAVQLTPRDERRLRFDTGPVGRSTLPAGRFAVLRHHGADAHLSASLEHLYGAWLPASGEQPRAYPLIVQRHRTYPDVADADAYCDLLLPLASPTDHDTGGAP